MIGSQRVENDEKNIRSAFEPGPGYAARTGEVGPAEFGHRRARHQLPAEGDEGHDHQRRGDQSQSSCLIPRARPSRRTPQEEGDHTAEGESASAGEQGRGFAVVADEVRQLAERVASATKEIATLIEGVQNGVEASVKAMEQGTTEMAAGSEAAGEAREALTSILTAVESATGQIQEIATRSNDLRSASEEMLQLVEEVKSVADSASESVSQIASVAEQNSAATEQVSAASEQMSAQVEEVSASAVSLGELADGLQARVRRFRLQEGDATSSSQPAEPTAA